MVYGVIVWGWWFNEIGSVFLFMGVIIPLVGGLSVNEMISKNIEGMSTVISAVLLISASRVITAILTNSNTMDTILYYLSGALTEMPQVFFHPRDVFGFLCGNAVCTELVRTCGYADADNGSSCGSS